MVLATFAAVVHKGQAIANSYITNSIQLLGLCLFVYLLGVVSKRHYVRSHASRLFAFRRWDSIARFGSRTDLNNLQLPVDSNNASDKYRRPL